MENALGEDIPLGVYRTEDKITNLKIKVKVRKIANACFTEKDSLAFGDSNEFELVNLMKSSTISAERIFRWQEKVDKTEKPEDASGGDASASKKDSITICLFSYNDNDILSPQWKNNKSYTYPSSKPTHLETQISQMKPKTRIYFPDGETWQKPLFSNIKRIIKEKSNVKETYVSVGQSMAIMAALFFEDSASVEEIDLCFLQVDDHGTLTVIPDFSKRKSYIFINSRSETFEYEIENVSNMPKSSVIQREKNLMRKIALYKRKLKEDTIREEFTKLPPETTSFSINFEIVSAKKFSSPDIFIHYLIIIPKGCTSENILEGVTETCRRKPINDSAVTYYGHIFSIDISANVKEFSGESLKVVFEATSVDYWGNFRNEGYGYGDIPMIPGMTSQDIGTWKIEPNTLRHKLQNFFIGGMPHLDDLSYIINPKDTKDSQLSKYGVRTISSGIITFKSSVIQQV
ncbi:Meckel syndrome type 1 [Araneus ventricosus]|uniref:Meckel syndrome type 1 n=1 Tax=Araneus ventricosus TaxID=182803 RepID=A0A4Y2CIL8_ARAVE|nr:Meckel syndrome type 1 [Araneus ventricosus]